MVQELSLRKYHKIFLVLVYLNHMKMALEEDPAADIDSLFNGCLTLSEDIVATVRNPSINEGEPGSEQVCAYLLLFIVLPLLLDQCVDILLWFRYGVWGVKASVNRRTFTPPDPLILSPFVCLVCRVRPNLIRFFLPSLLPFCP